jgi:integrase
MEGDKAACCRQGHQRAWRCDSGTARVHQAKWVQVMAGGRVRGDGSVYRRKGSAVWWCQYCLRGKVYRESTNEKDEQKALKFLRKRQDEVGADRIGARPFVQPKVARKTVSDLLDALETDYTIRGKCTYNFRCDLKIVRAVFGQYQVAQLTADLVDKYIADCQDQGKAPSTINHKIQLLGQAYKLAIKRGDLWRGPQIRKLTEEGRARQGFFGEDGFKSIVSFLPVYLQDYALFAYIVGWRRGAIANLEWTDVADGVVHLRGMNSKNRTPYQVPLEDEIVQIIDRRNAARVVGCRLVFHREGERILSFGKAWNKAAVSAGLGRYICRHCGGQILTRKCAACNERGVGRKRTDRAGFADDAIYEGCLFHDFRRTAVRNLRRSGVPQNVIMRMAGMKTDAIFKRYDIIDDEDLREALRKRRDYMNEAADGLRAKTASKEIQ